MKKKNCPRLDACRRVIGINCPYFSSALTLQVRILEYFSITLSFWYEAPFLMIMFQAISLLISFSCLLDLGYEPSVRSTTQLYRIILTMSVCFDIVLEVCGLIVFSTLCFAKLTFPSISFFIAVRCRNVAVPKTFTYFTVTYVNSHATCEPGKEDPGSSAKGAGLNPTNSETTD